MRVTLKDVAEKAHVNVSTVSRALNNSGYVMPETKQRILQAVEELSYRPNLLLRNMRKGKRFTIGLIVPSIHLSLFGEIAQAIMEELNEKDYETLLSITFDNPAIESQALNRLRNGLIDGIIIAGTGRNNTLIRDIQAEGIPILQIVRNQDDCLPAIVGDYEKTAIEGVKFLHEKGCQGIAFINGTENIGPFEERLKGYKVGMRSIRQRRILPNSREKNDYFQDGYRLCNEILDGVQMVDGIMVSTDFIALGVYRSIKEHGFKVPWDIRLISLTGHQIGEQLETSLTSMELPAIKMGKKAARLLIEMIEEDKDVRNNVYVFDSILVERESTE